MGFIKEFKAFAIKGNVIDLAVGVVIGAAFTGIVTSLVGDVITPLILNPLLKAAHVQNLADFKIMGTVNAGLFLSAIINFLIVALVLFLVVKAINKMKAKEEKPPAEPSKEEVLLTEIRDLLAKK